MIRRIETTIARLPLHLVLLGMALAWFTPTLGLLISSFRTQDAVLSSGGRCFVIPSWRGSSLWRTIGPC